MTTSGPRRQLPAHPSADNLRKQAKTLARQAGLQLAKAQHQLAGEYGFRAWAELMRAVGQQWREPRGTMAVAARQADATTVRFLLEQGHAPDGAPGDKATPLWEACAGSGPATQRIAVAHLLLDAGASPRRTSGQDAQTPLHAAARNGPLALVELLIRRGALVWQGDRRGTTPLSYARDNGTLNRDAIVELLDRPVIRDGNFRAAVQAIHAGDSERLARLLDRHPRLLQERAVEPDCLPHDYFRDPKLFWFIANNPTLMVKMPADIGAIARIMLQRGVEQADLDTTLELVISNRDDIMGGHQVEVLELLLGAGARASPGAIAMGLAHGQLGPVRLLLQAGLAITAPIAAALGLDEDLARLLPAASREELQGGLGLAVINRRLEATRLCLEAGADANAYLPVHKHSQPLHQAALHDDVDLLKLLVEAGASLEARDTLWDGTPLGWAIHNKKAKAEAYLRSRLQPEAHRSGVTA